MTRTVFIWITGIFAFGITGGLIGSHFDPYGLGGLEGLVAGICLFSCARLWLCEPRE